MYGKPISMYDSIANGTLHMDQYDRELNKRQAYQHLLPFTIHPIKYARGTVLLWLQDVCVCVSLQKRRLQNIFLKKLMYLFYFDYNIFYVNS